MKHPEKVTGSLIDRRGNIPPDAQPHQRFFDARALVLEVIARLSNGEKSVHVELQSSDGMRAEVYNAILSD